MEDAYGIGITNRYEFLLDTEAYDPQAILKEKAKKAKKAAKKNAGKENETKVDIKSDKLIEDKKVKFVVPGKEGKQLQPAQSQQQQSQHQQQQQQQQPQPQKSRSMKDTQNIQENGGSENGFREKNFERDRNNRNNRNYENREPRYNRRNNQADFEPSIENAGNRTYQENGFGNRGYRNNGNRNNEISNNGQDIEYSSQRERNDDRPARRQGNDRNFGNRRNFDGQRRNFDGRGGKREFDRQSGSDKTGVKAVEKREGDGAHNWGTHQQVMDDLKDDLNKIADAEPKDDGISDANTKPEENLVVEEVVTLTY